MKSRVKATDFRLVFTVLFLSQVMIKGLLTGIPTTAGRMDVIASLKVWPSRKPHGTHISNKATRVWIYLFIFCLFVLK